jgi:hypothetical protein
MMSSAFSTADRRKRVATYGKASRNTKDLSWNEEAPSPDRPRKQAGLSNGTLKRPPAASGGSSLSDRTTTGALTSPASHDIFDVPSEDGARPPPFPAIRKKPAPQKPKSTPADDFDVPSSGDEDRIVKHHLSKAPQLSRKPLLSQQAVPSVKAMRQAEKSSLPLSENTLPPQKPRANTPQIVQNVDDIEHRQIQLGKRPSVKPQVISRRKPSVSVAQAGQKKAKGPSIVSSKDAIVNSSQETNVFDVPLSDEEPTLRTPVRMKPAPRVRAKTPTANTGALVHRTIAEEPESDESTASRKRKRLESSQSSFEISNRTEESRKREASAPPRGRKHQKRDGFISPGHEGNKMAEILKPVAAEIVGSAITKPKRTRLRTVPSATKPQIPKGQSSPAKLHAMLAVRPATKSAPVVEAPNVTILEDETMYDIQDSATPVARSTKPISPGSLTPRQATMFSNLLGDPSDAPTPGMPSISKLQLSDRKPQRFASTSLLRSSSDITHTTPVRKNRLIHTLRQVAPIEEEEDDSESDEEMEESIDDTPQNNSQKSRTTNGDIITHVDTFENMNVDSQALSQLSQNALQGNGGSKVTYARTRSYLQESNFEDNLLLSMDFDDPLNMDGFGSNELQDIFSEDEDDPASQIRGIHELRRQGQNEKFQMETQTAIDDIADKGGLGSSLRRTAMLEFCTQLADEQFLEQLLESSLSHQFLQSISFRDEIIFDFAAAFAVALILKNNPGSTLLDEVGSSGIMSTLLKLLRSDSDINRIAKERRTNLSKVARETVDNFRTLVQDSTIWSQGKPEKITPQLVALQTLEHLVLNHRKHGSTDALVRENDVYKLLDIAGAACERLSSNQENSHDYIILGLVFSIMEALSILNEKQATWPNNILQRLVKMGPVLLEASGASPIMLALRLCVQLTNNNSEASEMFAGPVFVQTLGRFISRSFSLIASELDEGKRIEVMESLILSLGAMINLAEISDQARRSIIADGDELVDALAKIFLEGAEQAAQVRIWTAEQE